MTDKTIHGQGTENSRRIFRKSLVMPAEHGSWSWLLVPFAVGVLVAGSWTAATWMALIGGLAVFLMRRPATQWARIRSGRGRRRDERLAAGWTLGFAAIALASFVGLIALGEYTLLWLIVPIGTLLAIYLLLAFSKPSNVRTLWMELAGAAGLALMAPAGYIAGTGQVDNIAFLLWLLLAAQNTLGVLYVRLRIADTHQRPASRMPIFWAHLGALAALSLMALAGSLPWLATLPFVGFTLRSIWTARRARPVPNIKRFGFLEIGVEILGGLLIALAF